MPQFARPSADTYRDNYETHAGGTTGLWQQINEVTPDHANYIRTGLTPSNDVYVTKLTTVTDPVSSSGHTLDYTYGKDAAGGDQIDQTVQIRQGYVSEASPGTLIAQNVHTNVGAFPQVGALVFSAAECDAISNYGDLYERVVTNKP